MWVKSVIKPTVCLSIFRTVRETVMKMDRWCLYQNFGLCVCLNEKGLLVCVTKFRTVCLFKVEIKSMVYAFGEGEIGSPIFCIGRVQFSDCVFENNMVS